MILYYFPGGCSQACHIALIEGGLPHQLVKVGRERRTEDGQDFNLINGKGYTPALELDDGTVLTEGLAILVFIAEQSGQLLAKEGLARWRALEATAFMSTEIHRNFIPLFRGGSEQEKAQAAQTLLMRFGTLSEQLGEREFLVGAQMTIADCYLFIMLCWAARMGVAVPARLDGYLTRMKQIPSVAKALVAEGL
ncbi:glutathione S-transferase [Pseudomonas fluorescens]|uniref:Glutathione S-transferase n=1 Tax=Pseudomonas fluorescens TaxID=294 RepID=A0A1T2Y6L5_PSEFL|nr:glutathione S-transferase N-terminal domain-containing protein [Pseudomonas fluorescens]OPA87635.1 glutathione S-transferase [Pseudomonas fluorescens]